jgi:DNA-binding Lrp family transcriptional regulator
VTAYQLDDVDKQLLRLLQENSRYTALELAERVGVSDNTVHNRMERLEEADIITGYTTTVDHDRTGLDLYFAFTCTARISKRAEMAEEIMEFSEVVEVTELMTGEHNLLVKAYGAEDKDITRIAERFDQLDVEINDENLIRDEHVKPLNYIELDRMLNDED